MAIQGLPLPVQNAPKSQSSTKINGSINGSVDTIAGAKVNSARSFHELFSSLKNDVPVDTASSSDGVSEKTKEPSEEDLPLSVIDSMMLNANMPKDPLDTALPQVVVSGTSLNSTIYAGPSTGDKTLSSTSNEVAGPLVDSSDTLVSDPMSGRPRQFSALAFLPGLSGLPVQAPQPAILTRSRLGEKHIDGGLADQTVNSAEDTKSSPLPLAAQRLQSTSLQEVLRRHIPDSQKDSAVSREVPRGSVIFIEAAFKSEIKKAIEASKIDDSSKQAGSFASAIAAAQVSAGNLTDVKVAGVISAKLGTQDWSKEFSGHLMMMVNTELTQAKINISPKELGPLEINLKITSGSVSASFVAGDDAVANAISSSIGELRQSLESGGMSLANVNVSVLGSGMDSGFSQPQRQINPVFDPWSAAANQGQKQNRDHEPENKKNSSRSKTPVDVDQESILPKNSGSLSAFA